MRRGRRLQHGPCERERACTMWILYIEPDIIVCSWTTI